MYYIGITLVFIIPALFIILMAKDIAKEDK
jgi:hypothetical protein